MRFVQREIAHPGNNNERIELKFYTRYNDEITDYLVNEIFNEQIYLIERHVESPIILDCGANIGLSMLYFKLMYPTCGIIAFEPDRESFKVLQKNLELHQLTDVELINKAVSNTNLSKHFFTHQEDLADIPPICSLYKNKLTSHSTEVDCVNFGEFVLHLDTVDFLKIDIEGGESDLLASLIEFQSINRIKQITLEYHRWVAQNYSESEFLTELRNAGFRTEILKEEQAIDAYRYTSGNSIISAYKINLEVG